jgi:hypothetical protein
MAENCQHETRGRRWKRAFDGHHKMLHSGGILRYSVANGLYSGIFQDIYADIAIARCISVRQGLDGLESAGAHVGIGPDTLERADDTKNRRGPFELA